MKKYIVACDAVIGKIEMITAWNDYSMICTTYSLC